MGMPIHPTKVITGQHDPYHSSCTYNLVVAKDVINPVQSISLNRDSIMEDFPQKFTASITIKRVLKLGQGTKTHHSILCQSLLICPKLITSRAQVDYCVPKCLS